MLGTLV
jgi:hypothetical protein